MVVNYTCKPDHLSRIIYYLLLEKYPKRISFSICLFRYVVGLVVTSPVMEVEVASSIPARHSSTNLAWKSCKLNFQYTSGRIHNTSNTTKFKTTNKTTPPKTIDQNSYCYKLALISA